MEKRLPFARRVYSGHGPLVDDIVTEVADRPQLVRLVFHARHLTDGELDTLIRLLVRSMTDNRTNGHRH